MEYEVKVADREDFERGCAKRLSGM